jgi:hypothetical protein
MFREVNISVSTSGEIVFHFERPLSIEMLLVANAAEETLWDIIAGEYEEVPVTDGLFQSWPLDQAPPEIVAMFAQVQERLSHELEENGPRHSPVASVTYGALPPGYRERTPAQRLIPGEYNVLIFAEQGQGACRFTVAAA